MMTFTMERIIPLFLLLFLILVTGESAAQEGAYVNSMTVKQGDTLKFFISTSSATFNLRITKFNTSANTVRITEISSLSGGVRQVPSDAYINGCGWPESYRLVIPDSWEPGIYRATFPTSSGGGGVLFFVKAKVPGSFSKTLIVLNTNTWQAYNSYGGKSLYNTSTSTRSYKVSFLRPSTHAYGAYNFFKHEMKFAEWMYNENNKVEFASDYDIHSNSGLLSSYDVVVIPGHGEYWSFQQRENIQNYVNSGGKLMILSGNTCWWQVRFEDDGNTLVCYKDRNADPLNGVNNSLVTVNWYASPVNNPENSLTGVSFRAGGYVNNGSTLPSSQGYGDFAALNTHHWVYKETGLKDGDEYGFNSAIVGNEVDGALYTFENSIPVATGADGSPAEFIILGISPAHNANPEVINEHATPGIYHIPGKGAVFNAASISWVNGLASDAIVKKITSNVFYRFHKNIFPPDIISWSPFTETSAMINKESLPLNIREMVMNYSESETFSIIAKDPQGKSINYRWFVNKSAAGNSSSFDFSAGNDSLYIIEAMAYNSSDTTSVAWKVRVLQNQSVPPVPGLISPSDGSTGIPVSVELDWSDSQGSDFYRIQISESSDFSSFLINEQVTSSSFQANLLSYGTKYFWRVSAGNVSGTSQFSSAWNFTTLSGAPSEVILITPGKNQKNLPLTINFVWEKSAAVENYIFQLSTDKQFKSYIVYDSLLYSFDTIKTVTDLKPKKNYWWRVLAKNEYGQTTSEVRMFSTGSNNFPAGSIKVISAHRAVNDQNIQIVWESQNYQSDEQFRIKQKNADNEWIDLGHVSSASTKDINFSYIPAPAEESAVYRIEKYSVDGSVEISQEFIVTELPEHFEIAQNYPNPFNPFTTINYNIPVESRVSVFVYSSNGELIKTLFEGINRAGSYSIQFYGGDLASGIYIYTIEAESKDGSHNFSGSGKMVLVK